MTSPLLIVGASTRAAAQSAVRAGYSPICADMFADADLRSIATVLPVDSYPAGLVKAIRGVPSDVPLLYTGAIENHPRLLEKLARGRPLLGNLAEVVRRVRDPMAVAAALRSADLPALEVRRGSSPPRDGDWIWKPYHSAAGRDIRRYTREPGPPVTGTRAGFFQRFQPGLSCSALYFGQDGSAMLVGVARQLIGLPHLPFGWAGGIAPWPVSFETEEQLTRVGAVLAGEFGLRHLFGIDFILDGAVPWLVEVNPRYTATVELFEFSCGSPLLHGGPAPRAEPDAMFGKRVLYTPREVRAGDLTQHVSTSVRYAPPEIADIPEPGQWIPANQPFCTVYARGSSADECLRELQRKTKELEVRLF